ncbi:MAG: hypothetical protein KGY41_08945 [Desulfovermiculus sp.]|nr:hypothetical protein [Desulfovermiculus sp.]
MIKGLFPVLMASLLALALGCSSLSRSQPEAGMYGQAAANATQGSESLAYQFSDVPVPAEMKLQSDESFIMQTPQVKAGALVYTGWRVDPSSLSTFYMRNMPQEGWTPLSYFQYGHYLLVFHKAEKVSVIRINKGRLTTKMEIWVSPSMSSSTSDPSERVLNQ